MKHEYLHEAPVEHKYHWNHLLYHEYQNHQDRHGDAVMAPESEALQDEGKALLLKGPGDAAEVPTCTPNQRCNCEFMHFYLIG